jgi:hypothetical protein
MANQAQASEYLGSFTSFAGQDLKAVFANKTIGELQAISVQVTREKAGVYTFGSPNARSFSRGKRGIAGSAIVIQFDRDSILFALRDLKFQGDIDELRPEASSDSTSLDWRLRAASGRTPASPMGAGVGGIALSGSVEQQESDLTSVDSDQAVMTPIYADQIPPFNIVIAANNEYGDACKASVFGVEFLNEAWGASIDDLVFEKQYTFLARDVAWFTSVISNNAEEINRQAARST